MLILRTDEYIVDVDKHINKLATHLHTKLLDCWALNTAEYRAYGRCYRNPSKDGSGFVPEVYKGGNEYGEVMVNDQVTAVSFFGVGETTSYKGQNTVPVHLVFAVNLERLWNVDFRADADARRDVQNIVHNKFGFHITEIKTGVDNVYAEYNSPTLKERLKTKDMQPYHLFRINFELSYSVNNDCVKSKPRPRIGVSEEPSVDEF